MPTAESYARDIEYYREYKNRPENKEKEHQRYLNNKEEVQARGKAHYEANKERHNKISKENIEKKNSDVLSGVKHDLTTKDNMHRKIGFHPTYIIRTGEISNLTVMDVDDKKVLQNLSIYIIFAILF